MSDDDSELFAESLVMRIALANDLLPGGSLSQRFRRDVFNFRIVDVQAYFRMWKKVKELLLIRIDDRGLPLGYSSFKDELEDPCMTREERAVVHTLLPFFPLVSVSDFSRLFQWVVFDERVNLQSLDYSNELLIEYVKDECTLRKRKYDHLGYDVQNIVTEWFSDFDLFRDFIPKHGPGACRELSRREATPYAKCENFIVDEEISYLVSEYLPFHTVEQILFCPKKCEGGRWRISRVRFVPKTALTNRVISAEPATLQWLQQGVFRSLSRHFDRHPEMHITLKDQSQSRYMALLGSRDGVYATIDLSKASDFVTVSLVDLLFRKTRLYDALMSTRSRFTEIESTSLTAFVELAKFAPMGSACCFPIECIVFAAICECAIRRVTGRRSYLYEYRVYGDDIVILSKYAEAVISLLEQYGFIVNKTKSFIGQGPSPFREACGLFACGGTNVTPLRIGRGFQSMTGTVTTSSAGRWSSLISLINESYDYGFRQLRSFANAVARDSEAYYGFYRSDPDLEYHVEPSIVTDYGTDTNYRIRSRRSDTLHCPQYRVMQARTEARAQKDPNEELLYFLDFWSREGRGSGDEDVLVRDQGAIRQTAFGTKPPKLRWKWVSLS
jgi:hypothetical protein